MVEGTVYDRAPISALTGIESRTRESRRAKSINVGQE